MTNKIAKTIGIVGVTGLVGKTALDLLQTETFKFSVEKLKLYASKNSVGKVMAFNGNNIAIETPTLDSLSECDAILFASDSSVSKKFIPQLAQKGIFCVDKSSAFRMDPSVPLIVPEINLSKIKQVDGSLSRIIASPNCVAIPLTSVANIVHQMFDLQKMVVSTYQSVSGTGKAAIDVLIKESKDFFTTPDLTSKRSDVYPKSIAYNVIPFIESLDDDGHTAEEIKIRQESKKILHSSLDVDVTSVRVPTFVGHAMSVVCKTKKPFSKAVFTEALKNAKVIKLTKEKDFITPREVQGKNAIYVSRIRKSEVFDNGLSFWVACDNLRKGAALNALQIIETLF